MEIKEIFEESIKNYIKNQSIKHAQLIVNALNFKWGDSVSSAFVLGVKLKNLSNISTGNELTQVDYQLILDAFNAIGADLEIINAFKKHWLKYQQIPEIKNDLFLINLIIYLRDDGIILEKSNLERTLQIKANINISQSV